jgi:predicted dehydrogenase
MGDGEPVRWGILGTGRITHKILAGARASEAVEFVAAGSRTRERALAYTAEHGLPRAHGTYDALLADPDVEAVYISLPNTLHHEWTMRALAAGKHVLCEKPYSVRPADVVDAFDAAERRGLVLSEGFMWRHAPSTRRLMELLPTLGRLQTIRATFCFPLDDESNVRMRPELEGGSLMDVGCYCVSAARLLAGAEPERAYGEAIAGPSGVDVAFTGVLRFASGLITEFTSGFGASHMSLEAIGADGSISLADPWHTHDGLLVRDGEEIRVTPADSYRLELEDVSAAIRDKCEPLLGRADALGQARTIDALYRSAATGSAVAL